MISDTEARRIASSWHGGQGSALYALASTGAINTAQRDHDVEREIVDLIWGGPDETDGQNANDLRDLDRYVKANVDGNSQRGPQPEWSDLSW